MDDKSVAVLVWVKHDRVTSFLENVSKKSRDILSRLRIPIREYTGSAAEIARLWVDLASLKQQGGQIVLGVFVAHGREDQAGLSGATGDVLFEHCTAKQMQGAILVMNSCLLSGDFPYRIVGPEIGVRAVIGYKERLRVFPSGFFPRWHVWQSVWPWSTFRRFREAFANAVVSPIHALVVQGYSVEEAVERGRTAWRDLANDKTFDKRLRHVIAKNAGNLQSWPTKSGERLINPR